MGLVKGPLLSIDARGKIADTLVFSGWKGLKTVRAYVIPANPKSADQVTQRTKMTDAVAWWHNAGYSALDIAAWGFRASLAAAPRSGFNELVADHIDKNIAGAPYDTLTDIVVSAVGAAGFTVGATGVGAQTYKLKVGINPRALLTEFSGAAVAGAISIVASGLSATTKYYFKLVCTSVNKGAETGVYNQTTI